MTYYINKTVSGPFEEVEEKVTTALKLQGFGVLTEISVDEVFKKKLDIDFKKYKILGACNPHFAYQALTHEDKIGTMLPCNVILQELSNEIVEVAAVDPMASMISVENEKLAQLAEDVRGRLKQVVDEL